MIRLLLFRFWPVFIPLIIYWLWWMNVGKIAKKEGKPAPLFRDGPWYWAVITSLCLALLCFAILALGEQEQKGEYVPPHMEKGALVPGHVEQ
jgi:hypothetical protein